jgi:hypothetical protein
MENATPEMKPEPATGGSTNTTQAPAMVNLPWLAEREPAAVTSMGKIVNQ